MGAGGGVRMIKPLNHYIHHLTNILHLTKDIHIPIVKNPKDMTLKNTVLLSILFVLLFACHQDTYHKGVANYYTPEPIASGDQYNEQEENPFIEVAEQSVSTFSIDADGAAYANARRFISQDRQLPPKGAIRTEEFINYFNLNYEHNQSTHPISLNGEVSTCPWAAGHQLVRIGIKGKALEQRPHSNFVFLIDVSGSMSSEDKLDMLKAGFNRFVDKMDAQDRVALVTYAGSAAVVLESTSGAEKQKIKKAINSLGAGGSTAGAQGIITAYEIAQEHFIQGGNNRIIIGTDGDFNVGPSSQEELIELIEEKREAGVFITVLGVGRGNLNDGALEQIANNGNGNYEYIDNIEQLKKVFIYDYDQFYTVAKDVKVQIDFNPQIVQSYRLIGYENRLLSEEEFEDDTKDAGEIGANQSITALYEIIPVAAANYSEFPAFSIDFRYKKPNEDNSIPLALDVYNEGNSFEQSSDFMKFTASLASFAMLLTDSDYKGTATYEAILEHTAHLSLADEHGFKAAFRSLVQQAKEL